jgi:hypothetical protein
MIFATSPRSPETNNLVKFKESLHPPKAKQERRYERQLCSSPHLQLTFSTTLNEKTNHHYQSLLSSEFF